MRNWVKISILFAGLFFTSDELFGQPYGNEWIDENQTYYKFKIGKNGLYRITSDELMEAGFPVSSIPSSRIKLYRRGKEQAIKVNSSGGVLQSLEFYGEASDGLDDQSLYSAETNQLHPGQSIFSDSASYFLTYSLNNTAGQRIESYTEANTSAIAAESYYNSREVLFFDDEYSSGRRYAGGNILLSSYDRGEGWVATPARSNENINISMSLRDAARSVTLPTLTFTLVGANNNQHNASVFVGPDENNLRQLGSFIFNGYDFRVVPINIQWSDVGSDGSLYVRITPVATNDRLTISTLELEYPREFVSDGISDQEINLRANPNGKSFIRVTSPPPSTELFDITDPDKPIQIGINQSQTSFLGIVRNTNSERRLLVSAGKLQISSLKQVSLPQISPENYNYLIVTHAQLRTGQDQVARYAAYRSSDAGGGYDVLIAEIDDLYNLFSFGDPTPLAIRRFSELMLDEGSPEYLFIIGKGLTPGAGFYKLDSPNIINYVPTYGHPGTDVPFTAGLSDNGYQSSIPTGRISAFTPEEIGAYLDKVIEMEALPFDNFWRKNSLLLSGGLTAGEQSTFRSFIEDFENVLNNEFLGGNSKLISKEKSEAVSEFDVTTEINEGVSLVTFFGHSSASTSDIEVGLVSNDELGYTNKGRYPVFLVNGCNAGNFYAAETFNSTRIFGDDWILTPDLGAVGFIASSSFALSRNLKNFSDLFFQFGYADENIFGEGIGDILQLTGAEYINRFSSIPTNIAQVQQFSLNGDPALSLFGAKQPDYDISEEDVDFQPFDGDLIVATSDSFNIQIALKNFGRLTSDSIEVAVVRTLQNGEVISYDREKYPPVTTQDTLNYTIRRNPEIDDTGTSIFEIFIDPLNETEELVESNNSVVLTLDIFSGSTTNLYPLNYGIVPGTDVTLTYQLSNLISGDKSVLIELDTAANFDSGWKRSNVIQSGLLNNWETEISFNGIADGQVFYWRTKLENPGPSESDEWVTSSFSYLSGSPTGWRQATTAQLQSSVKDGVSLTSNKTWEFESESTNVQVETFGSANTELTKEDVKMLVNGSNYLIQNIEATSRFPDCANNTFNALVFDRRSAIPYAPIFILGDDTRQRLVCGRRPQLVYNFLERDITGISPAGNPVETILDSLIDESAAGDIVLLFNIGEVAYSKWPANIIDKLGEIGLLPETIENLEDGQPFIAIGKKGATPGEAIILSDNGSSDPLLEQALTLVTDIVGSDGEGRVESLRIGPATNWIDFSQQIEVLNAEDEFFTSIYGIRNDQREIILENFNGTNYDLSGTNANDFNFIELEWSFSDQTRQTPAQLDQWQVTFETLPDGLLIDRNVTQIVQEGANYQPEFGFYNYTNAVFQDSVKAIYSVLNRDNRSFFIDTIKVKAPAPGDTVFIRPEISTIGFGGINDIAVTFNIEGIPEQYRNNNLINRRSLLIVEPDRTSPVLDVTIDGRYIKNGEIVSSNPTIQVRLKDESKFFLKSDTVGMLLSLKAPCEGCEYERINFSSPEVTWTPATETKDFEIIYQPGDLEDGFYGLRVQAEDASGNSSGEEPFEINFNIATEPSIGRLTAFPNPFNNGVRFAFTLTGTEPPEDFTIRIYSLKGQLVRVVTMEELGELHIGENVTEPIWDGTDAEGSTVENGIYFYKIYLRRGGEEIDGSFIENGIGRLYLMR